MNRSVNSEVAYKKIDEAIRSLANAPNSAAARAVISALTVAKGRMQHLEAQLAATETMRDRIAMQLLPGQLAGNDFGDYSDPDGAAIHCAYELADKVLEIRMQGSAGALGETTSPDFSETTQEPTEAMIDAACKVCIGFSGDHGTYNDYLDRGAAAEVLSAALNA